LILLYGIYPRALSLIIPGLLGKRPSGVEGIRDHRRSSGAIRIGHLDYYHQQQQQYRQKAAQITEGFQ